MGRHTRFARPIQVREGYSIFAIDVGTGHLVGQYLGESPNQEHTGLKNVHLGSVNNESILDVSRALGRMKYRGPYTFISY